MRRWSLPTHETHMFLPLLFICTLTLVLGFQTCLGLVVAFLAFRRNQKFGRQKTRNGIGYTKISEQKLPFISGDEDDE